MYDLALNAKTHDLVLKDGDLLLIDNAERVAQEIKISLWTFLGEWFLDTTAGIPYLESILIKDPNITLITYILRKAISAIDDVKSVDAIELDYNKQKRTLAVAYSATTEFGLVTGKEVLGYGH